MEHGMVDVVNAYQVPPMVVVAVEIPVVYVEAFRGYIMPCKHPY